MYPFCLLSMHLSTSLNRGRRYVGTAWLGLLVGLYLPVVLAQSIDSQVDVTRLRMTEFFQFPVGAKGLEINPSLQRAQGQRVALQGYLVQQEVAAPGQFLLTPHPVLMSQHADGEADDLPPSTVLVSLPAEQRDWIVAYRRGLVEVVGVLDIGRQEGSDGRVSWVRLQLDSEATRPMNATEFLTYRHAIQHTH